MQYMLRNVFRLAIEAQGAREQIRLGEIYSSGQGRAKKITTIPKRVKIEVISVKKVSSSDCQALGMIGSL